MFTLNMYYKLNYINFDTEQKNIKNQLIKYRLNIFSNCLYYYDLNHYGNFKSVIQHFQPFINILYF